MGEKLSKKVFDKYMNLITRDKNKEGKKMEIFPDDGFWLRKKE